MSLIEDKTSTLEQANKKAKLEVTGKRCRRSAGLVTTVCCACNTEGEQVPSAQVTEDTEDKSLGHFLLERAFSFAFGKANVT